jgi:hypothetical protein
MQNQHLIVSKPTKMRIQKQSDRRKPTHYFTNLILVKEKEKDRSNVILVLTYTIIIVFLKKYLMIPTLQLERRLIHKVEHWMN